MILAEGRTLFHTLCAEGKYDEVKTLLQEDENDLDALDSNDSAPIHYAVFCNQSRIVELLCEDGAWIQQPNSFGDTPLDLAVRHNYLECLRILLFHGVFLIEAREKAHITEEMWQIQRRAVDHRHIITYSDDSDDFYPFNVTKSYDTLVEERMQKK